MKVIVITGGSDGLGKAVAEKLVSTYKVVILARNQTVLEGIAKRIGCVWYACDVRDPKQISEVIDKIALEQGKIDILLNNAGVIVNGELVDISDEDIENVITTNTLGSIYVAKAVLLHMKRQKSGLIINVISQSGLSTRAGRSVYNASKWALTGFTKALQQEANQYGVRVTGFYPGTIKTDMFAKAGIELNGESISTDDAVRSIEFVLSFDYNVVIPELGIKHADN